MLAKAMQKINSPTDANPHRCKKKNAEGRADGERAEGGDAVPGDDFCDVLGASASDAPDGGARADHAFADAEEEASDEESRRSRILGKK